MGYIESQVDFSDGSGSDPSQYKSMSLQTMSTARDYKVRGQRLKAHASTDPLQFGPLTTAGIEKACPPPLYKYTNRGAYAYDMPTLAKVFDEKWNHPKVHHPKEVTRPNLILTVSDIEGCKSKPGDVIAKPRGTNPLNPTYVLPSFKEKEGAPPPRFIRNNLLVDDIDGACPKGPPREVGGLHGLKCDDIDGARPGWRPPHRAMFGTKARDGAYNVADINARRTPYSTGGPAADVEGSHPKGPPDSSLRNGDIEGSHREISKYENYPFKSRERRGHKNTMFVGDIEGNRTHHPTTQERRAVAEKRAGAARASSSAREEAGGVIARLAEGEIAPAAVWQALKRQDRDSSGKISAVEVEGAFKALKATLPPEDVSTIVSAFDTDHSGYMDYRMFTKSLVPAFKEARSRAATPASAPAPAPAAEGGATAAAAEPLGAAAAGEEPAAQVTVTITATAPAAAAAAAPSGKPPAAPRQPGAEVSKIARLHGGGPEVPTSEWRPTRDVAACAKKELPGDVEAHGEAYLAGGGSTPALGATVDAFTGEAIAYGGRWGFSVGRPGSRGSRPSSRGGGGGGGLGQTTPGGGGGRYGGSLGGSRPPSRASSGPHSRPQSGGALRPSAMGGLSGADGAAAMASLGAAGGGRRPWSAVSAAGGSARETKQLLDDIAAVRGLQ